MITIHVEDTDGSKQSIEVEENPSGSLMEVLVEKNFDVPAICGGIAGCGTCHITLLTGYEKLDEIEEDEAFMLETLSNFEETSRLSCQLPVTSELDGADIRILKDGA